MSLHGSAAADRDMAGTILITQADLVDYNGSEIVTLELAEQLSGLGWSVHVLTNFASQPIIDDFNALPWVTIHTDATTIDLDAVDVIWVHHQLLPDGLLEQAEQGSLTAKVVFHHMSPFVPLEFPLFARVETWLADAILFNSPETQRTIESTLGSLRFTGQVFGNPAPDSFWTDPTDREYVTVLARLLVVSNHMPPELWEAVTQLRARGVQVRVLGQSHGDEYRRTLPSDLHWADAVVSIGKTVQYGIVSGLPVYCYDHFGGSGWLDEDNMAANEDVNFSGRGFGPRTASMIVEELVEGFAAAQRFARLVQQQHGRRFLLSSRWQAVTDVLDAHESVRGVLDPAEKAMYSATQTHLWELHRSMRVHWQRQLLASGEMPVHRRQIEDLRSQLAQRQEQVDDLQGRMSDLTRSRSWRMGAPLRWLKAMADHLRRSA
jgi:hypothetical protein